MLFTNNNTINSSSSPSPPHDSDDISRFLRQILHRSSSSSSQHQPFISASSSTPPMRTHAPDQLQQLPCFNTTPFQHFPGPSAVFSGSDRLVVDRISHDGVIFPPAASNLSSESLSGSVQLPTFENNDYPEDNDCESEEGNDTVAEEAEETRQQQSRNQSKRSRAAEVHNLSEKRRRSRINEKMKALQNLIPNSNKTDKASMLDEAIEYLKQLQLQVQMLSMRNGLTLHPMCLPGGQGFLHPSQLSQMGNDLHNGSGSHDITATNALNAIAETSNTMLNPTNQCTSQSRPSLPIVPAINDSAVVSFGLDSSMPASFHSSQLLNPPEAVCRERSMPNERLVVDNVETKSLVTTSTRPIPLSARVIHENGHNPVEERMQQKHGLQETFLENISGQNQMISSNYNGLLAASSGAQKTS